MEMRVRGLSFKTIGRELGISDVAAYKHVKRSLEELAEREKHHAEEHRRLDLLRIDKALSGIIPKAESGDPKAVTAMCRLLERRARLLGLDAPTRHAGDPLVNVNVNAGEAPPPGSVVFKPAEMRLMPQDLLDALVAFRKSLEPPRPPEPEPLTLEAQPPPWLERRPPWLPAPTSSPPEAAP
jgi:hypothetical protein